MLLFAVDLIVFLSLAAQFAIAGYFLYLVYWLIELPAADSVLPPLPAELPHVLVQIRSTTSRWSSSGRWSRRRRSTGRATV